MGTLRRLTVSAACAALLGLAASGIVRTHFSAIVSAMTVEEPCVSGADEPVQTDALSMPEPEAASTSSETQTILVSTAKCPVRSHHVAPQAFSQELVRGIKKVGERRYEIKRRTLDQALSNLALLSNLVRVAPDMREGKPFGYRLFAIRADGPMAKLGLRNDDVLVSVNGLDIATPDRVLNAYSKLKTASQFALGLVREGRQISQEYVIR
jgi:type II secretory pathway component PulC